MNLLSSTVNMHNDELLFFFCGTQFNYQSVNIFITNLDLQKNLNFQGYYQQVDINSELLFQSLPQCPQGNRSSYT